MTTTIAVNYAALSAIEQRRLAQENVANAEDAARVAAATETDLANAKLADLAAIDNSITEAKRRRTEIDGQLEDARRERGEALADGASTKTIDTRISGLRCEFEQLHDKLAALETRRNATEKEALVPKWHSIRERSNAINGLLEEAKAHAADLKGQLDVALSTTELLKVASQNYAIASDRAYKAILDHRTRHPALYPAES